MVNVTALNGSAGRARAQDGIEGSALCQMLRFPFRTGVMVSVCVPGTAKKCSTRLSVSLVSRTTPPPSALSVSRYMPQPGTANEKDIVALSPGAMAGPG